MIVKVVPQPVLCWQEWLFDWVALTFQYSDNISPNNLQDRMGRGLQLSANKSTSATTWPHHFSGSKANIAQNHKSPRNFRTKRYLLPTPVMEALKSTSFPSLFLFIYCSKKQKTKTLPLTYFLTNPGFIFTIYIYIF